MVYNGPSIRLAYDGRGNYVIRSMGDIQSGVDALGGYKSQLYAEQWVEFRKELAVMVARYDVTSLLYKKVIPFV